MKSQEFSTSIFAVIIAIALLAACSSLTPTSKSALMGDPAPDSAATRTITIGANTKYVNVTAGEVVHFVKGDTSFTWNFDNTTYTPPFDLRLVAPQDALDHKVMVYVEPNPLYMGDGGSGRGGEHGEGGHGGGHR